MAACNIILADRPDIISFYYFLCLSFLICLKSLCTTSRAFPPFLSTFSTKKLTFLKSLLRTAYEPPFKN